MLSPKNKMEQLDHRKERLLGATAFLIENLLNEVSEKSKLVEGKSDNLMTDHTEEQDMKTQSLEVGEWLTPVQAAELVGTVTARTVSKWARQGVVPARQINRRWYVNKRKLIEMLSFDD